MDAPVATAAPDSTDKAVPFAQIEKKPTFDGGNANEFAKWVAQNLKYPEEAKTADIQGRVMVQFTVCEDGAVRDVKVLRGVHPLLDAEAVRVLSASPKWEPGEQGGKPVKVTYQFPVIFKLNGDEQKQEFTGVVSYNNVPSGTISIRYNDGAGDPLIILDGKKYDFGKLKEIDPSTIESMEVLKDAATVEKYGEEAKNGVILITTKKQ